MFFFNEEPRKNDVAQTAGNPDRNKQEQSNGESLQDAEAFGLCPQNVEQRGRHAQ